MHRIPVAAISIGILCGPALASLRAETPAAREDRAPATSGRVQGYVKDAAGAAVVDASVLAVGAKIIAARTDLNGRFQMSMPPGDYILKATRTGYVSTYREPVRVHSAVPLERTITLIRQADSAVARVSDSHAHTELAWQLRHLPRSVLRDATAVSETTRGGADPLSRPGAGTFFGRAVDSSMRWASRIADTDFSGQLNFFTTSLANPSASMASFPRSVAYVAFGAPVGDVGDWRVRGAVGSGPESSWNFLGEYESHSTETHAVRFGMSFSTHASREPGIGQWSRATQEARSVAGGFARDVWRPFDDLEIEYALRADRYDYLAEPYLLSGSGGIRARLLPSTYLGIRTSRAMLAPGAEEFLPPPTDGPWLPPERTFSTLTPYDTMRAETVRHAELDLTRELGSAGRASAVHLRAFTQSTDNQIATLFETGEDVLGQYRVARVGTVDVTGWAVGFKGHLAGVAGHIEYSRLAADWNMSGRTRGLRRLAPFVLRDDLEWLNDLTATLDASFRDARTRLHVVYRANSGFSDDDHTRPALGSRFDVQLHQELPYRPIPNSHLELMFAVRSLFRDPQAGSSRYDELLTVAPPLRIMGGIQVRF